jgi:hypothetical protein
MTNRRHNIERVHLLIGNDDEHNRTMHSIHLNAVMLREIEGLVSDFNTVVDDWTNDKDATLCGFAYTEEDDHMFRCVHAAVNALSDAVGVLRTAHINSRTIVKEMREDAAHQTDAVNREAVGHAPVNSGEVR